MAAINYIRQPLYKAVKGPISPVVFSKWVPILGFWGAAAGAGVVTFAEGIPKIRQTILSKIPVVGDYWIRVQDPEDVPV